MALTEQTTIPTGDWQIDPVHSTAGFAIQHFGSSQFRTTFKDVDVSLHDGALVGTVGVDSVDVQEPNFRGHLMSPDFFDAERHPEVSFRATQLRVGDGGSLEVDGELTVKETTKPVTATGRFHAPFEGLGGGVRIGLELSTVVNRFDYGLNWNADLPDGRKAVGDDVTISVALELTQADA